MMDAEGDGFSTLLARAEQLATDMDCNSDLPRVSRNLPQILEAGQKLWSKNAHLAQESADVMASILLGSKGMDVPKISHTLGGLSSLKTFETLEPILDTDIQGFLKNERETSLLAVMEQSRQQIMTEVQAHQWDALEKEWELEKQKTINALFGTTQNFTFTSDDSILHDETVGKTGRCSLDNIEMAYSRMVFAYNECVIHGGVAPNLIDGFMDIGRDFNDKNVTELWNMVKYMSNVAGSSDKKSMPTSHQQSSFVKQAISYLEDSYKTFMRTTIHENLEKAQLGGVPGTIHLVRSFLNVRNVSVSTLEDGVLDNQPIWPLIYYCLRCGDHQAALHIVERVRHLIGDFAAFLKEYINSEEKRLTSASRTKIRLQYRRVISNSLDPYKRIVYSIIGRCDGNNDHSEVADKIDDYLWLKLNHMTSVADDDLSEDILSLPQFQNLLYVDFGESHFAAYQQPYLFVQVLLLTAQFEVAIEFLSRIDRLRCHAVHIALAFHELKLLKTSSDINSQLLTKEVSDNGTVSYQLNFPRLILLYTHKFEITDPREALQYFYFLRNMKTSLGENLFLSCVSGLVQETKEFEMLLGKIDANGIRRLGAIDKFFGDTEEIIKTVAKESEKKGFLEDAVKLYDLAKNHQRALELLNRLLCQVLSHQTGGSQASREMLKSLVLSIAERYKVESITCDLATSSTFYLLLDLFTFFDFCSLGAHEQALEVMKQLKLLPLTVEAIERKANDFKNYSDEIRRCLPDILIATMNCILSVYRKSRSSLSDKSTSSSVSGKDSYCDYLRGQGKALITFAGMLPYRMPGDTNARLIQMEVLLN